MTIVSWLAVFSRCGEQHRLHGVVGAGRGGVDDALIFDLGGSEYGNAKRYRTIVPDDMIERYNRGGQRVPQWTFGDTLLLQNPNQ